LFNNESNRDADILEVPLSVHENVIKTGNKMKKYFFIESDKIKKSNLEKPKLDLYE
jgi:hypothetical protein